MHRKLLTVGIALAITFAQAHSFAIAADVAPPLAPPIKKPAPPAGPQPSPTTPAATVPASAQAAPTHAGSAADASVTQHAAGSHPSSAQAALSQHLTGGHPASSQVAGTQHRAVTQHPAAARPGATAQSDPAAVPPTTIDRSFAQKSAQLAELENLLFGTPSTSSPVAHRIERLETEVFHKTEPSLDEQRRIDRLRETLIGPAATASAPYPPSGMPDPNAFAAQQRTLMQQPPNANYDPAFGMADPGFMPPTQQPPMQPQQQQQSPQSQQRRSIAMPPAPDLNSPEFTRQIDRDQADKYALEIVNEIRAYNGLSSLGWDNVAAKVAREHVADLAARSTVSHNSSRGENPDVRYTKAGGTDSMLESLVSLKTSGRVPLSKGLVFQVIKQLTDSQDDREALMAPLATQFGFSFDNNHRNDKVIAVSEVVTDVADIAPIPTEVKVGDKVEIKGSIKGPYRFAKISLAWEGVATDPGASAAEEEEQDEALPYFPPLDYTAYSRRAEHDWEKTTRALQIVGLAAVLGGSLFMPPVALAAPLIMTAGPRAPKPVSEIPIKGGVKVSGNSFEFKSPISKDNKEGIYYITVWVEGDSENNPIAISRRAIIARASSGANAPETSKADGSSAVAVAEKHGKSKDSNGNK